MKLLTFFEALALAAGGEICCYKGVCPTAERCNACIRGLFQGTLTRKSRHLCQKFWSSRCGEERRSVSCHAFGINKVLANVIPKEQRFDCYKKDKYGYTNPNCHVSGTDCVCEENDHLSGYLDESLTGLHYPLSEYSRACSDLEELSRTTRVKVPPKLNLYCNNQLDQTW